jgi:rubredoxin
MLLWIPAFAGMTRFLTFYDSIKLSFRENVMAIYKCLVCETVYDEEKEGKRWEQVADDWLCHVCESGKSYYKRIIEDAARPDEPAIMTAGSSGYPDELLRLSDDLEIHMADIHRIAESGESIIEPMRTKRPTFSWDDILIKGAQLAKIPLNRDEPVNTRTVIGPKAKEPLVIETPIYITHMSFGALSKETKIRNRIL